MGEFRIGRTFAQHFYPDARLGAFVPGLDLGSNFASGPEEQVTLSIAGQEIEWSSIASGAPASADVPVNAISTGRLMIHGVICVKSSHDAPISMQILILVDGTPLPVPADSLSTCAIGGYLSVPFLVETDALTLGAHTVSVFLTPSIDDELSLAATSSTIKIQEMEDPS